MNSGKDCDDYNLSWLTLLHQAKSVRPLPNPYWSIIVVTDSLSILGLATTVHCERRELRESIIDWLSPPPLPGHPTNHHQPSHIGRVCWSGCRRSHYTCQAAGGHMFGLDGRSGPTVLLCCLRKLGAVLACPTFWPPSCNIASRI